MTTTTPRLKRAISSNTENVALTFDDGLAGTLSWGKVLNGVGIMRAHVRVESVRPSPDGLALEMDVFVKDEKGIKQLPDETKRIDGPSLHTLLSKEDNAVISFQVEGQYGPMTLNFKPLGRHAYSGPDVTDAETKQMTLEEVQEWYTRMGWPRAGWISTRTKWGRFKGQFQLL